MIDILSVEHGDILDLVKHDGLWGSQREEVLIDDYELTVNSDLLVFVENLWHDFLVYYRIVQSLICYLQE